MIKRIIYYLLIIVLLPIESYAQVNSFWSSIRKGFYYLSQAEWSEAASEFKGISKPPNADLNDDFLFSLGTSVLIIEHDERFTNSWCEEYKKLKQEYFRLDSIYNYFLDSEFKKRIKKKYNIDKYFIYMMFTRMGALKEYDCGSGKEILLKQDSILYEIVKYNDTLVGSFQKLSDFSIATFGPEAYSIEFYSEDGNLIIKYRILGAYNKFRGFPIGIYDHSPVNKACFIFGQTIMNVLMENDKIPSEILINIHGEADGIPIGNLRFKGDLFNSLQLECIGIENKIKLNDKITNLELGCIRTHFAEHNFSEGFESPTPKFNDSRSLFKVNKSASEYPKENWQHRSVELTVILKDFLVKNEPSSVFKIEKINHKYLLTKTK